MRRAIAPYLLLLVSCAWNGCNRAQPSDDAEMPRVDLSIPGDVPDTLVIKNRDGSTTEENGKELYSAAFKAGWRECWARYKSGSLDPFDEHSEPTLTQEYGIEVRGRKDGFKKCRVLIWERLTPSTP